MATKSVRPPDPHPSGVKPPAIPPDLVPRHVALVMDGDGRWARQRGLVRTEGHKEGESSLLDVIMGANSASPTCPLTPSRPRTGGARRTRSAS
jgi:undecaprenyl diphosphate synthase